MTLLYDLHLDRPTSPREPTTGQTQQQIEAEQRAQDIHDDALHDAMTGRGDFWPLSPDHARQGHGAEWDMEQSLPILAALQESLQHHEWGIEKRWANVLGAVAQEAEKMAEQRAEHSYE